MGASTVSLIVREVVEVIWDTFQAVHMKVPSENDFENIAKEFYERWNFPNCLGAIDGKHIRIKCPHHSGSMYYNYKNFFSIVLQAVADANYKFTIIDVGGYGKQSDGGSFRSSSLFHLMENKRLHIPEDAMLPSYPIAVPYVFIGDEAYPLLNNLMRPFNRRNLDVEKEYFNMRLSRARRVVECAFGIISAKFRILWKPMETSPESADKIIKCICILHNIIIDKEGISIDDEEFSSKSNKFGTQRENNRPTATASLIRDTFKHYVCRNKI